LFFSAPFRAQHNSDIVRKALEQQQHSWNNGDIDGFMKYYWRHDSLKFIGSKGVTYGWQKTLENYRRSYPDKTAMGELLFSFIEITELGSDAVFVVGRWELIKEKPVSGHFTLLWRKIKDQWVIVTDHTS
jgi:ketosteroid isomerase-like protein